MPERFAHCYRCKRRLVRREMDGSLWCEGQCGELNKGRQQEYDRLLEQEKADA